MCAIRGLGLSGSFGDMTVVPKLGGTVTNKKRNVLVFFHLI